MSNPMYNASIPVFIQLLGGLQGVLKKAEDHAEAKKIEPSVFLQARLAPDMFSLTRQVQIACDFAKSVSARLAGVDVPETPDTEVSFADLQARINTTLSFLNSITESQFANSETREIVLRPGTPKEKKLLGQAYLLTYGIPQFFFHVTTAYGILRHQGVEIGKRDFMGSY